MYTKDVRLKKIFFNWKPVVSSAFTLIIYRRIYIYIYIATFETSLIRFCPVTYHSVSVLSTHWWEQHTHLLCGYTPSSIFNFDIFQPSVFTDRPMRSERERGWMRDWERQKARHWQQNEREGATLCSRISDDKQNNKCPSRVSVMLRIAYYHTTSTIFCRMQDIYFAQYAHFLCIVYLDDICQNVTRTTEQKLRGKLYNGMWRIECYRNTVYL